MSQEIGYAVVLADQLDKGRTLSMQFNFSKGASEVEMNAELDKLVSVMARQRARAQVPELEQYLKAQELMIGNIEADILAIDERIASAEPDPARRDRNTQVKQLSTAREQQGMSLEAARKKVAEARKELEELRKKAA